MFPFWRPVIAPVLAAAEARRVVEIGALRGDNTRQMIEELGPDAVLHVVDPAPGFDPSEHEREFAGRYVFHRALSLDVLGGLPAMDAALIDGDHNWYTVYHELRLLRERARAEGAPLPVLILHDVGWPYGRRDLYYSPETIPAEFRQPHRRAGMRPGRSALLPAGQGMSSGMWNAEEEGGPRNGVMTALDDFVAEHDRPLRSVVLPLYFGLAIVVEEDRLARQPALAAQLDRIESAEGRRTLLELGEGIRLRAVANHHTVVRRHAERVERMAARYLDGVVRELTHLAPAGTERVPAFREALDALRRAGVPGDVAIVGADPALPVLACAHLTAHDLNDRSVWVLPGRAGASAGPDPIRSTLALLDLPDDRVEVVADGLPAPDDPAGPERLSGLYVGHGALGDLEAVLERLGPRLVAGGSVFVEDASSPEVLARDEIYRTFPGT